MAALRDAVLHFWPLLHSAQIAPLPPSSDAAALAHRGELVNRVVGGDSLTVLSDHSWLHAPLDVGDLAYSPVAHLGACAY